jgi:hypothetical protein
VRGKQDQGLRGVDLTLTFSLTSRSSALARVLLGWEAKKPSFTDGLDIYYASWKAARE